MRITQKLFDIIPNMTIKDGPGLKRLYKAGDIMGRPMQNRLIMGATAIVSQPFIDEHNKRVDKKTARASRNRTIGKILAGTAVGCVVRGGIFKFVNMTTNKDISTDRWDNLLTPRNSQRVMPHLYKNRMRNYKTVGATVLALVVMLFTNILIDMPLTNKIANFLNRHDNKLPHENNVPTTQAKPVQNPTDKIKDTFKMKGDM